MLLIENVGNLVCPALFDLGEQRQVVVVSVTEGDDKPLKYPHMFRACDAAADQQDRPAAHVRFDMTRCVANAHQVNPDLRVLRLSAETGEGMEAWYEFLRDLRGHRPAA